MTVVGSKLFQLSGVTMLPLILMRKLLVHFQLINSFFTANLQIQTYFLN